MLCTHCKTDEKEAQWICLKTVKSVIPQMCDNRNALTGEDIEGMRACFEALPILYPVITPTVKAWRCQPCLRYREQKHSEVTLEAWCSGCEGGEA